ncbi:MAG TPA: hypothetical protein VE258_03525, partial [Ktedonobacterales bacterium]|nr:hypothetical protein [Ktedonobacterales bacterium]
MVLAPDLATARRLRERHPKLHLVTAAGELLTPYSFRGGGPGDAPLDVQARLTAAQNSLNEANQALTRSREDVEDRMRRRSSIVAQRAKAAAELDTARAGHSQLKAAAAAAVAEAERHAQHGLQLDQRIERYAHLLAQAQAEAEDARQILSEAEQTEGIAAGSVPEHEERMRTLGQDVSNAVRDRQEAEVRLALATQRHEDLARQQAAARSAWEHAGGELAQREAALGEQESQPALLLEQGTPWRGVATEIRARLSALEREPAPDGDALASLEAQVRSDEQRNVVLQVEAAHADDAEAAARVEVETCQAEVDRCAAALREDPSSLDETEPLTEVDWQKTEREVSRLQRRLDAIGAVNLLAPEEFAQSRGRCESLLTQLSDLEAAAAQLVELRERLEKDIDNRFRTVFQAVAINFQEFFQELFEGGRATLRLELPEGAASALDEGVDIL